MINKDFGITRKDLAMVQDNFTFMDFAVLGFMLGIVIGYILYATIV